MFLYNDDIMQIGSFWSSSQLAVVPLNLIASLVTSLLIPKSRLFIKQY